MRNTICISLILLALPAVAGAQTADRIEWDDDALDTMPPAANAWADVTAASLALEGDTLVATLTLTALPEMHVGAAYGILFHDGTREWYMVAVSVPTLEYYYGEWAGDEDGPAGSTDGTGTYTTGAGATVRIEMPVAALGDASVLSEPRAMTADVKTGALPFSPMGMLLVYLDEAQGQGELRLPRAPSSHAPAGASASEAEEGAVPAADAAPADEPAPSAPVPAAGVGAAVAAALVGAGLARRRR